MRPVIGVAAIALCTGFSSGATFDNTANQPADGGGGIPFDGAPRWTSHTCAVCHTNAPGQITIRLEADHPELFTTGYTPNMQYHLRVVMENEHEGLAYKSNPDSCGGSDVPFVGCDYNGFGLEIDDMSGAPSGSYAQVDGSGACATGSATIFTADTYILKDGTAALSSGVHNGATSWDLCWTAPASGSGTLTAYVAAVDGNGGSGNASFPTDEPGDDVFAGQVPLPAAGAQGSQGGGCDATSESGVLVALLALCGLAWRKHRRRALALALLVAGGCVHVRPRERETLAKRAMKFSPDPAEDELDLHMQEAREGSEGGYGTSGGGCGCN